MNFASDNCAGAAPEILTALSAANDGATPAYGGDPLTKNVQRRFNEIFEREVSTFFVATGGAANGLALSTLSPPYGVVFCHEESHIYTDECAGPEFITGGAKLIALKGAGAKITADTLKNALAGVPHRPPHSAPPAVLSITQATECGEVYAPDELSALCAVAHDAGLKVHMDGARFANALVALGCTPAEMSWKTGVDVLSFGGTKNGCLAAEAVVYFNAEDVKDFEFKRKRAGHLVSKHRLFAAQFNTYLKDGLWLDLARRANACAERLANGLDEINGVKIAYQRQANEVFVSFPEGVADRLIARGAQFYPWISPSAPALMGLYRLITSFATTDDEVDGFIAAVRDEID